MPATLPYTFTGQATLSPAQLDADLAALAAYTAAIQGTDIVAGTTPTAALVAQNVEFSVNMSMIKAQLLAAASATVVQMVAGIPSNENGTPYTVQSITAFTSNRGTASSTLFDVVWGFVSAGVWATTTTIIQNAAMSGSGSAPLTGYYTPTGTAITTSNVNPLMIGVLITQYATNFLANATDFFNVSLRLTRVLKV
jgi:hypothetical protein